MPVKNSLGVLKPNTTNEALMDVVRGMSSVDYQRRIPSASAAGIKDTVANLLDPSNRRWFNEFVDVLVNRIGLEIVRGTSWNNPLGEFKRGLLTFGSTIEEIQVGLLKAHNWDPDRDYGEKALFGRELPEVQANFHTVNRQDFYKVTVNEQMLKRAFLEQGGLSAFITQLMEAPSSSDQWDEFLLTVSLFREYEANGGFRKVKVPDLTLDTVTEADAKKAMRTMRATAGNLKYLSTQYNAAGMPVYARGDDLLLFTTPEFNASMDVDALAAAFNMERAQVFGRIIEVPQEHFGIEGAQAILTTREFFVIGDTLFENTSQYNPVSLSTNHFLHHHQIISASRFVPAVLFTSKEAEVIKLVTPKPVSVAAITFEDRDGVTPKDVTRGGIVGLISATVTDPVGGLDAVEWSVSGNQSERTFITETGVLHCGIDETATTLTVTATAVAIDPTDPQKTIATPIKATKAVPVVGPLGEPWPVPDPTPTPTP